MRSPRQAIKKTVTRKAPIKETPAQKAARKKALDDSQARAAAKVAKTKPRAIVGRVAARKPAQEPRKVTVNLDAMKRSVERKQARIRDEARKAAAAVTAEIVSRVFHNAMWFGIGLLSGLIIMAAKIEGAL